MTGPAPAGPLLEARGLVRRFAARRALDGVDLRVEGGEAVALFGPNGAGKTTLLRVLASSLAPTAGTLRIAGLDPRRHPRQTRGRVGVVGHRTFLYRGLTARQNLVFFGRLHGVPRSGDRAAVLLDEVGLAHRADDPVGALSRGMQQRLSLARALMHRPDLLLLDEPAAALDPSSASWLGTVIDRWRRDGGAVVLATHDVGAGLGHADRWLLLSRGRVADAGPAAGQDAVALARRLAGQPA
jgi:heme ABC exporter ATP-binding subunit CcmA